MEFPRDTNTRANTQTPGTRAIPGSPESIASINSGFLIETLCYPFGFCQFSSAQEPITMGSCQRLKWHSCVFVSKAMCAFLVHRHAFDSWVEYSYVLVCQSYVPEQCTRISITCTHMLRLFVTPFYVS